MAWCGSEDWLSADAMYHEGSLLVKGRKYAMRTDVMYEKASKMRNKEVKEMKEEVVIRPTLS